MGNPRIDRDMRRAAAKRCKDVAQMIVDTIAASPLTPVGHDAPHLRTSYFVDEDDRDGALVRCSAPYWYFDEFGTRFMRAKPHVRPAVEAVRLRTR